MTRIEAGSVSASSTASTNRSSSRGEWRRTEGLSEEGLEAVERHVHEEPPPSGNTWCVQGSELPPNQALLGTLEEEGVVAREIVPQVRGNGGERAVPRKLGGQVQEESQGHPLLHSPGSPDQRREPQSIAVLPEQHGKRSRDGRVRMREAKAFDDDLFRIGDAAASGGRPEEGSTEIAQPASYGRRGRGGRQPSGQGRAASELPSLR